MRDEKRARRADESSRNLRVCKNENCTRPAQREGFCRPCFRQDRRVHPNLNNRCCEPNCTRKREHRDGRCSTCNNRYKRRLKAKGEWEGQEAMRWLSMRPEGEPRAKPPEDFLNPIELAGQLVEQAIQGTNGTRKRKGAILAFPDPNPKPPPEVKPRGACCFKKQRRCQRQRENGNLCRACWHMLRVELRNRSLPTAKGKLPTNARDVYREAWCASLDMSGEGFDDWWHLKQAGRSARIQQSGKDRIDEAVASLHDKQRRFVYAEVRAGQDVKVRNKLAQAQATGRSNAYGESLYYCSFCSDEHVLGNLHVEHCIPWHFAQINDIWNLTLACGRCNALKGSELTPRATIRKLVDEHRGGTGPSEEELMSYFLRCAPGQCQTIDWPEGSAGWTAAEWEEDLASRAVYVPE